MPIDEMNHFAVDVVGNLAQMLTDSTGNQEVIKLLNSTGKKMTQIIEEENKKLIETVEELIVGAKDERDQIIKLYELNEIRQVSKIDSEIETFEVFKEDYIKIIEITYLYYY